MSYSQENGGKQSLLFTVPVAVDQSLFYGPLRHLCITFCKKKNLSDERACACGSSKRTCVRYGILLKTESAQVTRALSVNSLECGTLV